MFKLLNKKYSRWVISALTLMVLITVPGLVLAETAEELLGLQPLEESGLGARPITSVVARLINVAMGLLGIIAVVIILLGGFKWMTAAGNEEKVGDAKKLLLSGIIGLAIVLGAYAIARFVVSGLITATT